MEALHENPLQLQLDRTRKLFFFGGLIYLLWWGVVELTLPLSFNPIGSRVAVVSLYWGFLTASYRFPWAAEHLEGCFYACAIATVLHYFYLFHYNQSDINWVVGSYITVVALCACLESERTLFSFVLFVLICSLVISFLDLHLLRTVFLSGMVTILAFAYFGLRRRLHLVAEVTSNAQMFETLFDAVFEGILVSYEGKILNASKSFSGLFGYTKAEILNMKIPEFVIPLEKNRVQELLSRMNEGAYETVGVRKDGTSFPIEVHAKHYYWAGKKFRLSAIRDLTEIKKNERTRVLLEASAESLKLSDEFIAIASHELRTPLTAMKLQIDIARLKIGKKDLESFSLKETGELLSQFEHQVKRLTHLVEDMLYSSSITLGRFSISPETVLFASLVKGVLENLKSSFEHAQVSPVFLCESDFGIELDPKRIEQVVINLLSNTLKYAKGKKVTVTVRKSEYQGVLTVEDEGMGIATEDQERIFKRFERAVSSKKITGMGLGLFICKRIVEAHNGSIEVTSQLGKGTKFTVTLPLKHNHE